MTIPSRKTVLFGLMMLVFVASGLQIRPSPLSRPRGLPTKAKVNGDDESNLSDKEKKEIYEREYSRLKRCMDYPPFAYQEDKGPKRPTRQRKTSFRVRRSKTDLKTLLTRTPSRNVEVPTKEETSDEMSFLDFAMSSSSPFETDLLESIASSAKRTRILRGRSYARSEPFSKEQLKSPPSLNDLNCPPSSFMDTFWTGAPYRLSSFFGAYAAFPFITKFLDHFITQEASQLDEITSKFGPGVSILYGTFISLTLSILYTRQQTIQDTVASESAVLVSVTRNFLALFRKDPEFAIEAGQCTADQVRTLVRGSRGSELMLLMYSDPYSRMLELLDLKEQQLIEAGQTDLGGRGGLINSCRDFIKDLVKLRAHRLSHEALALPPTHFFILSVLTLLILLGFSITILPFVDSQGAPPNESSLLFAFLSTIYVLFYNFASDLNNPFQGVYQVRRSSTASHLLEAKWLIANHPLLRGNVDFSDVEEGADGVVTVRSPGLGDMIFERDELFPSEEGITDGSTGTEA